MEFKLNYQLTLEDYLKMQKLAFGGIIRKRLIKLYAIIGAFAYILLTLSNPKSWLSNIFIVIIGLLIGAAFRPMIIKSRLKKRYYANPFYQTTSQFIINETQVQMTRDQNVAVFKPEQIVDVKYYPEVIYLFVTKTMVINLQRRGSDSSTWERLNQLVHDYWDKERIDIE